MSDDSESRDPGLENPAQSPAGATGEEDVDDTTDFPEDAFISPDEPIVRKGKDPFEEALILPDEPIVRHDRPEGVVTSLGGEQPLKSAPPRGDLQWEIRRAAHIMEGLAHALEEQGMEALRIHPEVEPLDAMLRTFIAGYLVGRTDVAE